VVNSKFVSCAKDFSGPHLGKAAARALPDHFRHRFPPPLADRRAPGKLSDRFNGRLRDELLNETLFTSLARQGEMRADALS
jgi:hypothetical protein